MELHIQTISADTQRIRIVLSSPLPAGAVLTAFLPLYGTGEAEAPVMRREPVPAGAGHIDVARFTEGHDLLICRFGLTVDGEAVPGKRYVEQITDACRTYPYPQVDTKKGLQISDAADAKILGVRHSAINVNEGDFLLPAPVEGNTIEYTLDGRVFYFNKKIVEENDKRLKDLSDIGVVITLILLNSRHWTTQVPDDFWAVIRHPDYSDSPDALISQFNLQTEEGLALYRAFVSFLADRYTREDGLYGHIYGMIVGNEVNSGFVWCNAGEKDVEAYTTEYTRVVRLTWQTAAAVYRNIRIYLSFDHFWRDANFGNNQPMRYYGTKPVLEILNRLCLAEGQVPWHIAFHPYPEDLNYPDFWNDVSATHDDNPSIITFKNLEVLARFTYEPAFLCDGRRRRIILSEQGFNSHWTVESEVLQAAAYGHAYRKIMSIPEIDSFILHAHRDNQGEFGLNLGLWRRKKDSNELDAPKPIYYVFKAIDQKDEKGVYHWERY